MSEGLKKINDYTYEIDGFRISKFEPLWKYTEDRFKSFIKDKKGKVFTREQFISKVHTRVKRTTNKEKLYYSIAVLTDMGETDLADMYDAKIIAEILFNL